MNDENSQENIDFDQALVDNQQPDETEPATDSISPQYLALDLASALDELNRERESMFFDNNSAVVNIPEITEESIGQYIKQHGITSFLHLVKEGLSRAGYIKQNLTELTHKKSGVIIKF